MNESTRSGDVICGQVVMHVMHVMHVMDVWMICYVLYDMCYVPSVDRSGLLIIDCRLRP